MIRILFNRFSKVVTGMEVAGLVFLALAIARLALGSATTSRIALLSIVAALYAFIRCCTSVRWYRDAPRYAGIELQFRKAMVPTSYIMALSLAWFAASPSVLPLVIAAALLAVIAHVNVILLWLRSRDADPTEINYYSSGRFLEKP